MRDLLTADLYRLRRRPEVWLLLVIIPLGAALGFLTSYFAVPGHYFNSDPTAPPIPEIAIEQAEYFFPSSIFRALDDATWVLIAAFFLTATSVGAEFAWGTIRTALLARSDRGWFISSRITSIALICLVLVATLFVVGAFMPVVLAALGERQAADPPVQPDLAPFVASRLVAIGFMIGLAALVTLLTRNAALTILVALVYVIAELLIGSNAGAPPERCGGGDRPWPADREPRRPARRRQYARRRPACAGRPELHRGDVPAVAVVRCPDRLDAPSRRRRRRGHPASRYQRVGTVASGARVAVSTCDDSPEEGVGPSRKQEETPGDRSPGQPSRRCGRSCRSSSRPSSWESSRRSC